MVNQTSTKLMFDTLEYVKILDKAGASHADVHANALSNALSQNIYSQTESDLMYEAALKRFDERTVEMREQIREEMRRDREEMRRDREEMRRDREELRRDFNSLQVELRTEMKDLQLEMKQMHHDLRIEIKDVQETILKKVYLTASLVLAGVGVMSAFTHLFH